MTSLIALRLVPAGSAARNASRSWAVVRPSPNTEYTSPCCPRGSLAYGGGAESSRNPDCPQSGGGVGVGVRGGPLRAGKASGFEPPGVGACAGVAEGTGTVVPVAGVSHRGRAGRRWRGCGRFGRDRPSVFPSASAQRGRSPSPPSRRRALSRSRRWLGRCRSPRPCSRRGGRPFGTAGRTAARCIPYSRWWRRRSPCRS
jgi:hypothetical protein